MAERMVEQSGAEQSPVEGVRKPWFAPVLSVSAVQDVTLMPDDAGEVNEGGWPVANS
ncbi:hypothetical protein [Azospirillum sp. TSO22-1]|uniref:hypothetical protein n=1 Tax=Azospirillum sp. TSO22-1 TaxID=716789 RepID=UPI0013047E46|nr:hypothetical protein [Azospirillum sp. TSO22-1]